jgi:hypothetical protein
MSCYYLILGRAKIDGLRSEVVQARVLDCCVDRRVVLDKYVEGGGMS